MHIKKYIAEALGTATLTLVVELAIKLGFPVIIPVLAGLVLCLFVYSIGEISGCHINPAVTVGLWSVGKIKPLEALNYIVSQFIGAAVVMYTIGATLGISPLTVSGSMHVIIAELLGTFLFTFGIASVVYGKTAKNHPGFVIGGSLALGIVVAALIGSNGVLNPAVAFGIGSFSLVYVLAPIVGSILGMNLYKYLAD